MEVSNSNKLFHSIEKSFIKLENSKNQEDKIKYEEKITGLLKCFQTFESHSTAELRTNWETRLENLRSKFDQENKNIKFKSFALNYIKTSNPINETNFIDFLTQIYSDEDYLKSSNVLPKEFETYLENLHGKLKINLFEMKKLIELFISNQTISNDEQKKIFIDRLNEWIETKIDSSNKQRNYKIGEFIKQEGTLKIKLKNAKDRLIWSLNNCKLNSKEKEEIQHVINSVKEIEKKSITLFFGLDQEIKLAVKAGLFDEKDSTSEPLLSTTIDDKQPLHLQESYLRILNKLSKLSNKESLSLNIKPGLLASLYLSEDFNAYSEALKIYSELPLIIDSTELDRRLANVKTEGQRQQFNELFGDNTGCIELNNSLFMRPGQRLPQLALFATDIKELLKKRGFVEEKILLTQFEKAEESLNLKKDVIKFLNRQNETNILIRTVKDAYLSIVEACQQEFSKDPHCLKVWYKEVSQIILKECGASSAPYIFITRFNIIEDIKIAIEQYHSLNPKHLHKLTTKEKSNIILYAFREMGLEYGNLLGFIESLLKKLQSDTGLIKKIDEHLKSQALSRSLIEDGYLPLAFSQSARTLRESKKNLKDTVVITSRASNQEAKLNNTCHIILDTIIEEKILTIDYFWSKITKDIKSDDKLAPIWQELCKDASFLTSFKEFIFEFTPKQLRKENVFDTIIKIMSDGSKPQTSMNPSSLQRSASFPMSSSLSLSQSIAPSRPSSRPPTSIPPEFLSHSVTLNPFPAPMLESSSEEEGFMLLGVAEVKTVETIKSALETYFSDYDFTKHKQ